MCFFFVLINSMKFEIVIATQYIFWQHYINTNAKKTFWNILKHSVKIFWNMNLAEDKQAPLLGFAFGWDRNKHEKASNWKFLTQIYPMLSHSKFENFNHEVHSCMVLSHYGNSRSVSIPMSHYWVSGAQKHLFSNRNTICFSFINNACGALLTYDQISGVVVVVVGHAFTQRILSRFEKLFLQ